MFERFADSARQVVVLAQDEAATLHSGHIGTEHLLIALAAEPSGPAGRALRGLGLDAPRLREDARRPGAIDPEALALLGIDLDEVRRRVEAAFGPGALERRRPTGGRIPFTPTARRRSSSRSARRCRAARRPSAPSTSCSGCSRPRTSRRWRCCAGRDARSTRCARAAGRARAGLEPARPASQASGPGVPGVARDLRRASGRCRADAAHGRLGSRPLESPDVPASGRLGGGHELRRRRACAGPRGGSTRSGRARASGSPAPGRAARPRRWR